jgi:hypothetical protein
MNEFDQIRGGEAGESLKRALTAEPTKKLVKFIDAQRVAGVFAENGVAPTRRDHYGYRLVIAPGFQQKSFATPHTMVFERAPRVASRNEGRAEV